MSPSPSTDSGVSDSTSNDGHSEQLLHVSISDLVITL